MKLLGCRFNWRFIFTYVVINVHSSVMWEMNHLLISVKWIEWFINIWILHISWICVLEVHTAGCVNVVCIWWWVRSLNMSFYFGVCLSFFVYLFWFCMVLWVFLIVVFAEKMSCIMSEMSMSILLFISCTHNMDKSGSGSFKFVGYYTVDPKLQKCWL
jgi:hypothetical protein